MFNLFGKFGEIKERIEAYKEKLPFIEEEAYSEDYNVKVVVRGDKKIKSIEIKETLLNAEAQEDLQIIIRDTVNDAIEKVTEKAKGELKKELGDKMPDIPGLNLDSLLS